jgi:uncharacterized protein YbjT (DUF2867 family)
LQVVGLTRNTESDASKAKQAEFAASPHWKGFVVGDARKPETLPAAFAGATGIFIVTQFFETGEAGAEEAEGRALIDAAAAAGVQTIVYSGLDSPLKRFGVPRVHHFEGKYNVEEYLFKSSTAAAVTNKVVARLSFYTSNLLTYFAPRPAPDGSGAFNIALPMGDKKLKISDPRDHAASIRFIFEDPAPHAGKRYNIVSDYVSVGEIAAAFSATTGKTINYYPVPVEAFAKFPFPHADDFAQMFAYYQACPLEAIDEPIIPKAALHTLPAFVEENTAAINKLVGGPATTD